MLRSTYYNAGYRQNRSRRYHLRWPSESDASLHGTVMQRQEKPISAF